MFNYKFQCENEYELNEIIIYNLTYNITEKILIMPIYLCFYLIKKIYFLEVNYI